MVERIFGEAADVEPAPIYQEEEDPEKDEQRSRQRKLAAYWCCTVLVFLGLAAAATAAICLLRVGTHVAPTVQNGTTTSTTTTTTTTTGTGPTTTSTIPTTTIPGTTTTITTTTTTTTTTIPLATFNETCISNADCNTAAGLECSSGVCLCATTSYWSYGSAICTACRSGWTPYVDCCFKFVINAVTFADAAAACSAMQSQIITTENAAKFAFMSAQYKVDVTASRQTECWVNASATQPFLFYWPNGNPMNPSFWDRNQPNNSGGTPSSIGSGGQACVVFGKTFNYKFNDWWCDHTSDTYCEYYS